MSYPHLQKQIISFHSSLLLPPGGTLPAAHSSGQLSSPCPSSPPASSSTSSSSAPHTLRGGCGGRGGGATHISAPSSLPPAWIYFCCLYRCQVSLRHAPCSCEVLIPIPISSPGSSTVVTSLKLQKYGGKQMLSHKKTNVVFGLHCMS